MATMFDTGTPQTAPEILTALRRLQTASESFLTALPPAVFVQPQGEKWSPADHVRHLVKSTVPLTRVLELPRVAIRALFGKPRQASRTFVEVREDYRARLAQGATAGRFAPSARGVPDDAALWQRHVITSWDLESLAFQSAVERWSDAALDRYRLPHPLLGKLTVREMLFFTLYHNAHHLELVASRS